MMSLETKELTSEQKRRYNRHLILDGFGKEGQLRLLNAKVLVVGAGGLGSPIVMYLAAAGVGTIGIVDGDTVSITNLQRQVIHGTSDIGRPKVDSAFERAKDINPDVNIIKHELYLTEDNALELIRPYDYVLEGSDNSHTHGTACYRCLFPEPPEKEDVETCSMVGVLGSIAGMLGTVQATEAIKYLAGVGEPMTDAILTFDALSMQWMRLDFCKNDSCALCGKNPTITELKEYAFKPCSKRK